MGEEQSQFSRWRTFFWPIHRFELKKLLPMLLIFFLISFSYNVLRTMKDTLLITAPGSGAEVIPFVKVWVMFPGSILLTYLFTRLSNRLNRESVFYVMISTFLLFFFIFTFVLYPMRDSIHLHAFADHLQTILPVGCKGLVAMVRYWSFTAFYAMSELWGNIVLFLLFWGFANQVTKLGEAKRFYGLFGVGANLSGIFAGQVSVYCCQMGYNPRLPFGETHWEQTMVVLISLILLSGVLTMVVYRWMNKTILTDARYYSVDQAKQQKVKQKMSMRENFRHLFKSNYLRSIAVIVLAYNLIINLVEVLWKHHVHLIHPDPISYNMYMNKVTIAIGICSTLAAIFISGNSVRKFGWTFTASITPIILLFTSIGFFGFILFGGNGTEAIYALLGISPLSLIVVFGTLQNCLSRAAKYTVYDATKEMAFVPLDPSQKMKGKAAIDGVCTRLGKSGGSVIHQGLLFTFSTLTASAPYVAGFLLAILSVWMYSVRVVGRTFADLSSGQKIETEVAEVAMDPAEQNKMKFQEKQVV